MVVLYIIVDLFFKVLEIEVGKDSFIIEFFLFKVKYLVFKIYYYNNVFVLKFV